MTLRVGITRALPEAERTAARVRVRGAEPIVAPLLTIVPRSFDRSIEGVQALAFTSANGVRAFPFSREAADLPVFAVGDATADAARAAGFVHVHAAGGDVQALAALLTSALKPGAGRVLHISGADIAGDLVDALRGVGIDAERRVAYSAIAVTALPDAYYGPLDVVLFHSARAAALFTKLGAGQASRLQAACLSEQVAQAAGKAAWKRVIVAPAPREEALLDASLEA
ncbi:MAG: uroporphyrinogen-III synthase [Hyphomonadaceae bacterium]|nr:uroporphyrinogen-III synthase [Hyphomonadaceae bacterium]